MSSENKKPRKFESKEKLSILKRHYVNGDKVSDICEQNNIHPSLFYRWQAELFTNGDVVFEQKKSNQLENKAVQQLKHENEQLQKRIHHKDNVIAEITEDYVKLKKNYLGL